MQNQTHPTDFLLVQVTWPAGTEPDSAQRHALLQKAAARLPGQDRPLTLTRGAWAQTLRCMYGYLALPERVELSAADLLPLQAVLSNAAGSSADVRVSRLECVFEREGHSIGEESSAHYVVEMDPEDGWMPEISRWYDEEHMPGLAAVPGCVHAWRMLNHDHGPLSLACYDLVTTETMGSPPWLAVRATDWSSVTRPHFTNTKRTMFSVI